MPTPRKIELVDQFAQKFKNSKSIFFADYSGINVAKTTELRRSFREANVEFCVLKNTLAKRSFENAGIEGVSEMLQGMTSFAFSTSDAIAPVRVISDFNKKSAKEKISLDIKGCIFEGQVFDKDTAADLANLPPREVLLAQFASLLKAPLTKLAGTLKSPLQKLHMVLSEIQKQKSS